MNRRQFLLAASGGAALIATGGRAVAATTRTYYVSPDGSDASAGTSMATAWRTLSVISRAGPGSVVLLRRGASWAEPILVGAAGVRVGAYGAGPRPIIDGASPSGRATSVVTVDGVDGVVIEDLAIRNAGQYLIKLRNCTRARIRRCHLQGSDRIGVQALMGGGQHTIEDSEISGTGQHCAYGEGSAIQFLSTTVGPNVVQRCSIHGIGSSAGDHGIYSEGGDGNLFLSNQFADVTGVGIKVRTAATHVGSNLMTRCGAAAVCVDGARGALIDRNTASDCGSYPRGRSPYVAWWFNRPGAGCSLTGNTSTGSGIGIQVEGGTIASNLNRVRPTVRWGHWNGQECASLQQWRNVTKQDLQSTS